MEITPQEKSICISVNGEARTVPGGLSVSALLDWLRISSDRVAVEMNKSIVRKRDWMETEVPAAAQLEVVEFVGGG